MKRDNVFVQIKNSIYNENKMYEYSTYGIGRALVYALVFCLFMGIISLVGSNRNNIKSIISFCNNVSNVISDNNISINNGQIDTNGKKIKKELDDYYIYFNESLAIKDSDKIKNNSYAMYTVLFLKDGVKIEVSGISMSNEWKYKDFIGNTDISSNNFSGIFKTGKILTLIFMSMFCLISTFINYVLLVLIAACVSMLGNIVFKTRILYKGMFNLVMYSATLPTVMASIFNIYKPDVSFYGVCILGTIFYTVMILREISKKRININA